MVQAEGVNYTMWHNLKHGRRGPSRTSVSQHLCARGKPPQSKNNQCKKFLRRNKKKDGKQGISPKKAADISLKRKESAKWKKKGLIHRFPLVPEGHVSMQAVRQKDR